MAQKTPQLTQTQLKINYDRVSRGLDYVITAP